ncbi:MAG: hypothetical protein ACI9WU_000822 [Myxococcota bacterium]|jgi:hypothetical protein
MRTYGLRISLLLAPLLLASCVQVSVRDSGSGDEDVVGTSTEAPDTAEVPDEGDEPDVQDIDEGDGDTPIFFDPDASVPPDAGTDEGDTDQGGTTDAGDVDGPDTRPPVLCEPSQCADGLVCTTEVCIDNECVNQPAANTCAIGGVCYNNGAKDPASTCRSCVATQSGTEWTNIAGFCDDSDACTINDACAAGECTGTPDPGCGTPQDACTYHQECNPEGVCALWKTTNAKQCSAPCSGTQGCPAGQVCSKLPGSANIGYCEAMIPGALGPGNSCETAGQCSTGLCAGICVLGCLDHAACPAGTACIPADAGNGSIITFCAPDAADYIPNGQPCTLDGNSFGGNVCLSGHCDLLGAAPWNCAGACASENDCLPSQECNLVFYGGTPNSQSGPFSETVQQLFHDGYMACHSQAAAGFKGDGQVCSLDTECTSGKCQPLDPNNLNTKYCTSFCTTDTDCPPSLKCRMDGLALTSKWLTSPDVDSQGPLLSALTYVRVCRLP